MKSLLAIDGSIEARNGRVQDPQGGGRSSNRYGQGVILDEAEEWAADLIVVGSRGHGALDRFLLGSVSHAVTQPAKCSVEVVRRRSDEKKK